MKRKHIFTALLAIVFTLFLVHPLSVHAGSDVYISDTYDCLAEQQIDELNRYAREISDTYGFGVYAHILYDEDSYDDIWSYIEQYYSEQDLGYGDTSDGILFLITQSSRGGSYDIYIPAVSNQTYFTIDGLEEIQDKAEDYLFDHDYYGAIRTYLEKTEEQLAFYKNHDYAWNDASSTAVYYDPDTGRSINGAAVGAGILIPLLIAIVVVAVNASKHKTKHIATDASYYVPKSGQLHMRRRSDTYLYRNETRARIHTNDGAHSGGSSGGFSSSGGMHSGGGHF